MKRKFKNLKETILILFVFSSVFINAQVQLIGEAGVQISDTKLSGAGSLLNGIPQAIISPYANIKAAIPVAYNLELQAGLGYSEKGFKIAEAIDVDIFNIDIPIGVKATTRVSYLELPMNFSYKIGESNTQLKLIAGASLGYGIEGTIQPKATLLFDVNLPKQKFKLNKGYMNRWDVSGKLGMGIEHKMQNSKIGLNAAYVPTFTNFLDNPIIDVRIKPVSYQVGLSYHLTI